METIGRLVTVVIAVWALFIFPLQYYSQKNDAVTQNYVATETARFVDSVREQGVITQAMYTDFMNALDNTEMLFKVEIEHSHRTVVPSATGPTQAYDKHYEEEILHAVYEKIPSREETAAGITAGVYKLAKGDYVTVTVTNREKSLTSKIQQIIYRTVMPSVDILTVYGGEVRDENY